MSCSVQKRMTQVKPHESEPLVPFGIAACLAAAASTHSFLMRDGSLGHIAYAVSSSASVFAVVSAAARRASCAVVGCGE